MTLKIFGSDMVGYGAGPAAATDVWATETWTEIGGLVNITLHRMSNAYASYIECTVACSNQPVELGQRFLMARSDLPVTVNVDFVGRVDDVQPSVDSKLGQTWLIRCRDYLAVLQDNYVEPRGRNRYNKALINAGEGGVIGAGTYAAVWEPDWSPGSLNSPAGTTAYYRALIAAHLAMNSVDLPSGIRFVSVVQAPSSTKAGRQTTPLNSAPDPLDPKPHNLKGLSNKTLADAIRDELADDPWLVTAIGAQPFPLDGGGFSGSGPSAEGLMLADGVTQIPGIGSEFIIDYNPPIGASLFGNSVVSPTPGFGAVNYVDKQVRYAMPYARVFARGVFNFDPALEFWYGDQSASRWPILSYKFPKEGSTLYTRGKLIGKAGTQPQNLDTSFLKTASAPSGQGSFKQVGADYSFGGGGYIPDNDDEVSWDPVNRHYGLRRMGLSNDESEAGDENEEFAAGANVLTQKSEEARLRAIRMSQTPASLRPYIRGQIKVPGLPRNTAGYPLTPGVVINVNLPPLFVAAAFYVVDSYTYAYPEDVTTIELARRPWDDLGEQLKRMRNFSLAAGSAGKSQLNTGWVLAPANRSLVVSHGWGQRPTSVEMWAAEQDGTKVDKNGHPIPKRNTETLVGEATFDVNNGAWIGKSSFSATDQVVNVGFSGAMVYSDGASRWLLAGQDIIRVVLRG